MFLHFVWGVSTPETGRRLRPCEWPISAYHCVITNTNHISPSLWAAETETFSMAVAMVTVSARVGEHYAIRPRNDGESDETNDAPLRQTDRPTVNSPRGPPVR